MNARELGIGGAADDHHSPQIHTAATGKVNPVTVISRLVSVPAVSWAARIMTSGTDTSGARPAGSGGNGRFRTWVDTAATFDAAACGRNAGGTMKISTATGTTSNQATDPR